MNQNLMQKKEELAKKQSDLNSNNKNQPTANN
jgi:hypothetical protein